MEDENGYQLEDKASADAYSQIIERQERNTYRAKLKAFLLALTLEQSEVVIMLRRGMSVSDIAKAKGIAQSSVWQMRERIQKKFEKIFNNPL